jgi:hypothetical protein
MDEFLDRYVTEEKSGKISSPSEFVSAAKAAEPARKDFWDHLLGFVIGHPMLTIICLVLPLSFIIQPLGTLVLGFAGIIFITVVYANATILYLVATILNWDDISYSRMQMYSIPLSFLLLVVSPLGMLLPIGIGGVATLLVVLFALRFEIGMMKTIGLSVFMMVVDYGILFAIAMMFGSAGV